VLADLSGYSRRHTPNPIARSVTLPLTSQQSAIDNQPFMSSLKSSIERLASLGEVEHDPDARKTFLEFRDQLTQGKIRAAEKVGEGKGARWIVNPWVKQGILLGFRVGVLAEMPVGPSLGGLSFVDKDTFPARQFTIADRVRVVPGGSSVREGAYVAPSVICMPPMFINVGAYVDEGTMVDSHALVGSCAQIGKRVHLSAAAQVGGVLEPINAAPVIIEDDVLVGGNCGIYEGTLVHARAVLGAGTILTRSTPLYDLVKGEVYRATADAPLEVPENAVVVPGSRAVKKGAATGEAKEWNLSLYTPVIVKYRDEKTDKGIELEDWLR
jgi:2,3,4,5-tetrahydropyridine-2-carboxylate N-succinyltransferase